MVEIEVDKKKIEPFSKEAYRKISGERYHLEKMFTRNSEAKTFAEEYRNRRYGNRSRVLRLEGNYHVYVRASRGALE